MTNTHKTLTTDENPIKCHICGQTVNMSVDRARAAKWRIPWHPGGQVTCPTCWDGKAERSSHWQPQPYDEPMF